MKITRTLLLLSFGLAFASATYAQTYVSNTGNDSGSCPITAPCMTFQYAAGQTPAFGQLNVLSDGSYGSLTIDNAITINGHGFAVNFQSISIPSITVQVLAGNVVLIRDLIMHGNGAAIGISYTLGSELLIDHVKLDDYGGNCINVAIAGSAPSPADMVIKDTTIDNCSGAGISIASPAVKVTAEISNTQVHYANAGLVVNNGLVTVFGSTFSPPSPGGQDVGISVASANTGFAAQVMLDNCGISNWGTAISSGKGESVRISRSTINFNTTGLVSMGGGAIVSNGNNSFYGNGADGTPTSTVALK